MSMAYVTSRFELSRRRENRSFGHHAGVPALRLEEQDRWLDQANLDFTNLCDIDKSREDLLALFDEAPRFLAVDAFGPVEALEGPA